MLMSGMERQMEYQTAELGADTIDVLSEVADVKRVHELMDPVLAQADAKARETYARS